MPRRVDCRDPHLPPAFAGPPTPRTMARKTAPSWAPTDEQLRIVRSAAPRLVVEANAGVGKTTTLCLRALRLLDEGLDPARILVLTHTRPGSEAVRAAFARLGAAARAAQVRVETFDRFAAIRLRVLENARVELFARPEDVRPFVLEAVARARAEAQARAPGAFALQGTGELAVESLLADFERLKGTMALARPGEPPARVTPALARELGVEYTTLAVFAAYERLRRVHVGADGEQVRFRYVGDPTYDLACALAADDPAFTDADHPLDVGELAAIFVDEFHDTNRAMATVLRELMRRHPQATLACVGDVDQVIHAASGADADFLRAGFEREFGPAERLPLTEAQRFGAPVARLLGAFAGKPYPWRASCDSRVEVLAMADELTLALHVRDRLEARRALRPAPPASELAILLRHPNAALDLEFELLNRGVYYEARGFTPYMSRPEVLFVRLLLAAACGADDAFAEATRAQAQAAAWEFVGGALPQAGEREGEWDPETGRRVREATLRTFVTEMLPRLLARTPRQAGARRIEAALGLVRAGGVAGVRQALQALDMRALAAHVFVDAEAVRDAEDSAMALERMLARHPFASVPELLSTIRAQEERQQSGPAAGRIVLSTIPRAKGLEYEHVIVPGLDRGAFDGDDEDERHLFYVAVSRARRLVELVHRPGRAGRYITGYLDAAG